jgi:AbiV family abortive infection protein
MPKRHILTQYNNQVTPEQASEGIRIAEQNAKSLLEEAELLLEHKHWSRACALSILAIEEAGKPHILRSLLLARNQDDLREGWRDYRRHINKNAIWILPVLIANGARTLDDFRAIFDENSDHTLELETVKQIALYSDAYEDCNWSCPINVIDKDLAENIYKIAKLLIESQSGAMSTQAELEIWVKHMRPVWKQSNVQMKLALVDCYTETEEKGLLSGKPTAKDMARFMGLE